MGSRRIVGLTGVKFTTARPTAARALRAAGLKRARGDATEPWYGCGDTREATERAVAECLPGSGDGAERRAVVERLCRQYGALAPDIARLAEGAPNGLERIPGSDAIRAEIDYCIDQEHCRTLADFVLRRSGLGSLGAPPPDTARYCAAAMGGRLGWDQARIEAELAGLASRYRYLAADS
jgi:glycerol-3-phosphate dehydrogenase